MQYDRLRMVKDLVGKDDNKIRREVIRHHAARSCLWLLCTAMAMCAQGAFAQQATDAKTAPPSAPAPSTAAPQTQATQPSPDSQKAAQPQSDWQKGMSKPSLAPELDPKSMRPLYETIQEDWSSLSIGTSKLEPEPPVVLPTEDHDTFTRTLVQVRWRPGDRIDLWIIMPKGVKKPGAVLYLYNFDQDTDRFRNDGWAARVTGGGMAAVGFVSALSSQRFHSRPMKQWFVSEMPEAIGSTVHDVKFILDYLAQRGDIDMDRIGMFGEGSGGSIAILAAAADPRIKAVDTLWPWGDWPLFLAKDPLVQADPDHSEYVKPEFLKRVAPLDPVQYLPQLKIPVRIIQVREMITPFIDCQESIKRAVPKQAEVPRYETLSSLNDKLGQGRLFQWMTVQLRQTAKPEPGKLSASQAGTDLLARNSGEPSRR